MGGIERNGCRFVGMNRNVAAGISRCGMNRRLLYGDFQAGSQLAVGGDRGGGLSKFAVVGAKQPPSRFLVRGPRKGFV